MAEALNPYRQWLGLDTDAERLNHYELLGLPAFAADTDTIHHAADRALAQVRGHRPGAHAAAWAALLDELAEAKACLTDPAQKSAYDAALRKQLSASGPSNDKAGAADDAEIAAANQLPDLYPPGMQPRAASPSPSETSPNARATTPGQATSTSASRNTQDVAGSAAAQPKPPPPPAPTDDLQRAGPLLSENNAPNTLGGVQLSEPVPPGPVNAHVGAPKEEPATLLPIAVSVVAVVIIITLIVVCLAMYGKLGSGSSVGTTRQQPAPPAAAVKKGVTRPVQTQTPQQKQQKQQTQLEQQPHTPAGEPATPLQQDPGQLEPSTQQQLSSTTTTKEVPDTKPPTQDPPANPVPNGSPPADKPTPAELARLSEALAAAQTALGQHEFEAALEQLQDAQESAVLPQHQALVTRTTQLAGHARDFWKTVASVVAGFQGAEELQIGSGNLIVLVVEAGPESLTVRREGRNYSYSFREMPPGLALAIAKTRIQADDPAGLLQLGACLATMADRKPIYLDEARRYWLQAQAAGADVEQLLLTLTDSYDLTGQ